MISKWTHTLVNNWKFINIMQMKIDEDIWKFEIFPLDASPKLKFDSKDTAPFLPSLSKVSQHPKILKVSVRLFPSILKDDNW